MPFQKGAVSNPRGRPKGVPNKTTAAAKAILEDVAGRLGGADRMLAWVQEDKQNERVFWSLIWPKLLPIQQQVSGAEGGPLTVIQRLTGRDG